MPIKNFWGVKMNDTTRPSQTKKERRTYPRKTLVSSVSYKVMLPSGDKGLTQNISEGGICLMLNRALNPGTILELKFELPEKGAGPVESLAKVVWQKRTDKGFLTGVKFGAK